MYIDVYIYIYTHIYVYICISTVKLWDFVSSSSSIESLRHGDLCVCVCVCMCLCLCVRTYLSIYLYMYICVYTVKLWDFVSSSLSIESLRHGENKSRARPISHIYSVCIYIYIHTYIYLFINSQAVGFRQLKLVN